MAEQHYKHNWVDRRRVFRIPTKQKMGVSECKPAYVFGIYGVCRLTSVNVDIGSGHNDDLCECYWSGVLGVKNIHCSGCCDDGKLHIQQNACVQG